MLNHNRSHRGFTLIELLIVIAIILILIAIALPNFLEAQIRARVTKAKGELRTIHTALESYFLDWGVYVSESEDNVFVTGEGRGMLQLTSPIAYITSVFEDPFANAGSERIEGTVISYEIGGLESAKSEFRFYRNKPLELWVAWSKGPDGVQRLGAENPHVGQATHNYSATNGTKSEGSLYVWGGDGFFIGVPVTTADRQLAKRSPAVPLNVDDQPYVHRLPPY